MKELAHRILPSLKRPTIEMDELWSFVGSKAKRVWIWLAIERQTRRIVGVAFGDRSEETCSALWSSLPADYRKRAVCITAELSRYDAVLPQKRHRKVKKGSGETNTIEQFNNPLRQRCPNLVRKSLSFSKDELLHQTRIRIFIDHYHSEVSV